MGIYSINSCINNRLWYNYSNYFLIISLICLIPSSFSIIFGASCRHPLIVLPAKNLKRPTSSFICYLHYIALLIFQYIARWLKIRVAKGTQKWSDVVLICFGGCMIEWREVLDTCLCPSSQANSKEVAAKYTSIFNTTSNLPLLHQKKRPTHIHI